MKKLKSSKPIHQIHFYSSLATNTVSCIELSNLVEKRMKLLRAIESNVVDLRLSELTSSKEDSDSHFLCRLVCACTAWSTRWFVNMETTLFRLKIMKCEEEILNDFFYNSFLPCLSGLSITDKEIIIGAKTSYTAKHIQSIPPLSLEIRVHFTKLNDLVGKREIKLKQGYAILTPAVTRSLLYNEFRLFLSQKMEDLREIVLANDDERIKKLSQRIFTNSQTSSDFSSLSESEKAFPPCISGIITKFKSTRHLKYTDRQTLTRFFKDIGMCVDETILFFRNNFNVPKSVFDKEYLYSIRHNYGLEGKRAQYQSYGCLRIIGKSDDSNCFGCPFMHNKLYLNQYIKEHKVGINDIEELCNGNQIMTSCGNLLKAMTGEEVVNHSPLNFYRTMKKKIEKDKQNDVIN
ncbi:DNA primase large subunit [Astathelohania contejeani]|uniref:DNA primase large subunit n=1 Tax=Astathelohania contejeani TaxID=164912 RepID=A0ABQ7HYR7_9MICR|nr:DNA primase large subunit [Thelohania contejeani]